MAKRKPINQPEEPQEPTLKTFEVESEYGPMLACKHQFNGKSYIQREMTSPQLEAIGELLIESDVFGAVKADANGDIGIDAGAVVSHLIHKKLIRRFLVLLLTHDDRTPCTENEFNGRASEFLRFIQEVFTAFFTLNPEALTDIGGLLIAVLGTAAGGGQLIAMLLAGKSSSGAPANTGQKQR